MFATKNRCQCVSWALLLLNMLYDNILHQTITIPQGSLRWVYKLFTTIMTNTRLYSLQSSLSLILFVMLPELPHINYVMASLSYIYNSILVIFYSIECIKLYFPIYSKCTCDLSSCI